MSDYEIFVITPRGSFEYQAPTYPGEDEHISYDGRIYTVRSVEHVISKGLINNVLLQIEVTAS